MSIVIIVTVFFIFFSINIISIYNMRSEESSSTS